MIKVCRKWVPAIAVGVAVGAMLAICAHDCHLWSSLGTGLVVGLSMAVCENNADQSA